jgi:hypothetical protein
MGMTVKLDPELQAATEKEALAHCSDNPCECFKSQMGPPDFTGPAFIVSQLHTPELNSLCKTAAPENECPGVTPKFCDQIHAAETIKIGDGFGGGMGFDACTTDECKNQMTPF